jgi:truncated hemoglobin YjbI
MENRKVLIETVVRSFYEVAINDVFIGYHFRKLSKNSKLESKLGEFESHIPNVVDFWASQLIAGHIRRENGPNVLKLHEYLNIRKGELGRWLILFREKLNEFENEDAEFIQLWREKVETFEKAFTAHFF